MDRITKTKSSSTGLSARASPHELRVAVRVNCAAAALGISRTSLYQLMADGKIKSALIAGCRVVPVTELDRVVTEGVTIARLAAKP